MNIDITATLGPVLSGAFAMFGAILLWPRTRDASWMLVILAVILAYGASVFKALETFGLVKLSTGLPLMDTAISAVIANGPYLLLGIGLLVAHGEKKRGG